MPHRHPQSRVADVALSQSATLASAVVVKTSAQQSRSAPTSTSNTSSTMASQPHSHSTATTLVVRPDEQYNASLSSPRLWLESQLPLNGGGGAYTVLRCDYYNRNDDNPAQATSDQASSRNPSWTVWGRDFHMQRLRDSMAVLVKQQQQHSAFAPVPPPEAYHYDQAEIETDRIMNQLLHECVRSRLYASENNKKVSRTVFMVTLLWTLSLPTSSIDANQASGVMDFQVQGHICRAATHSGDDTEEDEDFPFANYAPQPLTVVVAFDRHGSQNLPNRQPYPRAKLSTWCRERRPLEDRFRTNCYEARASNDTLSAVAVDEVLLVRQQQQQQQQEEEANDDSVILLEGLTSNLFVLYPNGVLRTADDQNVLRGFARHLVMTLGQNDNEIGKVDSRTPIRLNEADQWQQVFVTSAIRLIVPVGRILVVAEERDNSNDFENGQSRVFLREIWNQNLTDTNVSNKTQSSLWRKLYTSIIEEQYDQQKQR